MAKYRPFIGLTPGYNYEQEMAYIKSGYFEAVQKAGGIPVTLSFTPDEELLDSIIEKFDGFIITGGPDIDAKYFNEVNLPCGGEISPLRDGLEICLVRKAIENNKPLLGICRGIQVMNVAMGGSIYQDIHSQIKDRELIKHSQTAPKWYATHNVLIEKGSKVWDCFKEQKIGVNSFHHQAIKNVASGFRITSAADDGIIESIEYGGHGFAVGVQWHPELMWKSNPVFLRLFELFVENSAQGITNL